MQFTCTQENLHRGLSLVSHVAAKTATLPVLNNVLLKVQEGRLLLSTTNLEVGMMTTVRGKVESDGAFTVQARVLSEFVALLPKENITLSLEEQSLHVRGTRSHTVLRGTPEEEFPVIPTVEDGETLTCAAAECRAALAQVIFACAYDESRPEISGVLLRAEPSSVTLVGTDSYRLAERKLGVSRGPKAAKSVIIPARTIHELIRVLGESSGELAMSMTDTQAHFSFGDTELISRLVEGQYPDYEQIIPKSADTEAFLETDTLMQLVKSASLFCKPGINDLRVSFAPQKNELVLSAANSQLGENESRMPATLRGKENAITFNYRYLLEGLQNLGAAKAKLEMTSDAQPGVLRPEKGAAYTYLIMPIRQ